MRTRIVGRLVLLLVLLTLAVSAPPVAAQVGGDTIVAPSSGFVALGFGMVNSVEVCRVPGAGVNKVYLTADPNVADKGTLDKVFRVLWHNANGGKSECWKLVDQRGTDGIDTDLIYIGTNSYPEHVSVSVYQTNIIATSFLRPYFNYGTWPNRISNAWECAENIGTAAVIDGQLRNNRSCRGIQGRYVGSAAGEPFVVVQVQVPPGMTVNASVGMVVIAAPLGVELDEVVRILSANPAGGHSDTFEVYGDIGYRDLAIASVGDPLVVQWITSSNPYPAS